MRTRIALAALLLLLTACGDPKMTAEPSVTSSPTSSSTPAPPKRESPQHFIRRWAAEETRMENTGDASAYLAMSRRCRACRSLAAQVRRYYAAGGYVQWGGWRIKTIQRSGKRALVYTVSVVSTPTQYKPASNRPTIHLQGGPAKHQLTISFRRGWQLVSKVQVPS